MFNLGRFVRQQVMWGLGWSLQRGTNLSELHLGRPRDHFSVVLLNAEQSRQAHPQTEPPPKKNMNLST